ncbi:MAG TPA: ATP-binding protein [Candidatus Limnocylindrales bacterium]|jgi:PAS domain S-box-containing protein
MQNQIAVGSGGADHADDSRRVRGLLLATAFAAMVVGTIGQLILPARGSSFLAWLDTAVIPAVVVILLIVNRRDRPDLLVVTLGLLYLEAILTASLFTIGLAFSIVVPIIGIGLVGPRLHGRASVATYIGAWAVATISVFIAEFGNPPNPLGADVPLLTVLAFALVSAGALGLMWRAGNRQAQALAAADREIAARIEAKAELERTADFLDTLIRSSPVATIALDPSGTVTLWNPAAERVFGWTEMETTGRALPPGVADTGDDDVGGHAAGVSLPDRILRSMTNGPIRGDRIHGQRKDGSEVTVELHVDSRADVAGRTSGMIVQAIDVTARSLLEAQLQQAQKLEAVGKVAGGIAHDINNALTAVGGFTELIEAESDDPTVKADARAVADGVDRASQLTRQLLAFAQRSALRPQVIDAADFVDSMAPVLRRLLGSDIELIVRHDDGPTSVHVDPGQFEQAILHLADNALDAMPGGGTLTIATGRAEVGARAAVPMIAITVTDTGAGIPIEFRDQVFEPFFTTKGRGPAGGLGLSMVHGFVAQSGGEVALESTSGEGTTIEIRLPGASVQPAVGAVATPRLPGGHETILVVDDEPAVAAFTRRALVGLGYQVLEAADAPAAIQAARTHPGPIDLILCDVVMPGMSGPEAVEVIRPGRPESAVLFASGYTADAIMDRGEVPAGVDLLEKPFTGASLAARVREVLDARPPAADA